MNVMDERELLRACRSDAPKAALAEIVRRHVDLVYAAALRQVRDPHLAEEVTQAVFLVLCRKVDMAGRSKSLAGWLLTVTRFTAVDAMRRQMRQTRHEQAAARARSEAVESGESWAEAAPVLDEALAKLRPTDRDAIALRFFQDQPLAEVGRALGIGEAAAQKRVSRALEKLRILLSKRGVQIGLVALGTGIAANGTMAAPPHLAGTATATAMTAMAGDLAAAGAAGTLAKGTLALMAWAKVKLAMVVVASLAICGGAVATATMMVNRAPAEPPVKIPAATAPVPRPAPSALPNSNLPPGSPASRPSTSAPPRTAAGVPGQPQSQPGNTLGRRSDSPAGSP